MKNRPSLQLFSIIISTALLAAPLPISAIAEHIAISDFEKELMLEHPEEQYISLGNDTHTVHKIISYLKKITPQLPSDFNELLSYLEEGFSVVPHISLIEILDYAHTIIENHRSKEFNLQTEEILEDLTTLTKKIATRDLTINIDSSNHAPNAYSQANTLIVNEDLIVHDKSKFRGHVHAKKDITGHKKLHIHGNAHFNSQVRVDGRLSAGDAFIESLSVYDLVTDDLTIEGTISAQDAFFDHATINNLTMTVSILDSVMNNITIPGTISATDAVVSNATVHTLSVSDGYFQNLSVANCIPNLCATTLSTTNQSITGTLSVTDINITNDLRITHFTTPGVLHNDASGNISSSLITNSDISSSAQISDTKLATINTTGKIANSATSATSLNTPNTIVLRDNSGNFAADTITANLIGNASSATIAGSTSTFSGSFAGDVTGTQSATVVASVGGQSSSNIATGVTLANAATSIDTANSIVRRDNSGNFAAGTITANLIGNASTATTASSTSTFSGSLAGDVTGTQSSTVVASVGGQSSSNIAAGVTLANNATSIDTANSIVRRDNSGNFSAGTITANLIGNASTATTAGSTSNFSGALAGDVTGTQSATVVASVGGQSASNIATGVALANGATSTNTTSALIARSSAGGFSAGAISITDAVISNAAIITPFTTAGIIHNNSSGLLSSSLIVNTDITNSTITNAKLATISNSNTPGNIVVRDGSGNFATNMITIAGTPTNPTDVATKAYVDTLATTGIAAKNPAVAVGTSNQNITGLTTIDGVTLTTNDNVLLTAQTNPVENGLWLAQAGAWTRPTDFASGTTADAAYILILSGTTYAGSSWLCSTPNAIIDTDPISFSLFSLPNSTNGANVGAGTGLIFDNKTGNTLNFKSLIQDNHLIITNGIDDITLATDGTNLNSPNTLVARDASGNFAAGTITANLIGNASTATTASSSSTFSGSLAGDVTGTQSTTIVASVGGQSSSNIATGVALANNATSANTVNTIVRRDSSGNFIADTITADLIGNASTATTAGSASNFSGSLAGDVTGTQSATVVTFVGGQSAANIATGVALANSATNTNTANTIVLRDNSGNFAAGLVSVTDEIISNSLTITPLNTAGIIHNSATGLLSSSLIVNADVAAGAAITDNKLATITTAGKVANSATTATTLNTPNTLVLRDGSGNFAAGTITANLIGNVTGNITAGTLTLPAGSASVPSLQFTGSTNTGMSAPSTNTLSLDINGVEKLGISASAITLGANLVLSSPLCNQAIQVATPGSLATVTANATTSVLILKPSGILPLTVTVVFPPSPTNGQYFNIILGTNLALTLINNGNGALISNGLTGFAFGLSSLATATYIYYAPDNTWYRCA